MVVQQIDTSALATSSFAGDLALDDAVRAVKDVLPPRAQGVSGQARAALRLASS
jgi:predicted ATPase with chaperone activity